MEYHVVRVGVSVCVRVRMRVHIGVTSFVVKLLFEPRRLCRALHQKAQLLSTPPPPPPPQTQTQLKYASVASQVDGLHHVTYLGPFSLSLSPEAAGYYSAA